MQTWPWVKFESRIEVQLIRLDDWAKNENLGAVDFIWADTQGAEEDVIRGGMNVIDNSRFFYTEYGAQEWYEGQISLSAMYDLLPGFSIVRLFPLDVLFENIRLTGKSKARPKFRAMRDALAAAVAGVAAAMAGRSERKG